uniref:Uncharacterized protein n=1 Tax=Rhizophora mucronata TaxID=61149 RepID=A0A2P2PNW2_RHIMU
MAVITCQMDHTQSILCSCLAHHIVLPTASSWHLLLSFLFLLLSKGTISFNLKCFCTMSQMSFLITNSCSGMN